MKLVVVAALVTVIAILGSRLSFTRLRLPLGLENFFLTGTEYVLVGLLLGSAALDLLDASTLQSLHPFMGLGLSWIGMLFGVQWEFKRLRRIPPPTFAVALLQAVVTMIAVALPFYLLFRRLFAYETDIVLICAISLAAAASDTGQSGLALVTRGKEIAKKPLVPLLQNVSNLDGLVGVIAFGLVSCLAQLHDGTPAYQWIGISVGLGLTVGLLMAALTAYRLKEEEMLLVVIGSIAFGGGLALYLNLSPLLVNLIAGAVVANLARSRGQAGIRSVLLRGERSIYVLFLILVGAAWQLGSLWIFLLAFLYLVSRIAGKLLGGGLASRLFLPPSLAAGGIGLGLLSHGGMALAIVVNLHQIHRSALTDVVISIILLGMLVSELIGPTLLRRTLEQNR
ncbi:MAG: hypothetical protein HOC74_29025 [Gemmatimonadetes bacterium]|jgi:hypothetical protein|nr:hypothetical protein [Gemmatimonadota bacterium]